MDKKQSDQRKAEGWEYIGVWLDPADVKKLNSLKRKLGYVESAPLLRRLVQDAYEGDGK